MSQLNQCCICGKPKKKNNQTCSRECGTKLGHQIRKQRGPYPSVSAERKKKISDSLKGHTVSQVTRDKLSKRFKGKKLSSWHIEQLKKGQARTKHKLITHHIDLDHKNDKKENKMRVTKAQHNYIHRSAYIYLVEVLGIEEVYKYNNWLRQRGIL